MEGHSYRVPIRPVEPGEKIPETPENFRIIESMPVKSLITYPKTGASFKAGRTLALRGHAWAGDKTVAAVHTSIDYGATWHRPNSTNPKTGWPGSTGRQRRRLPSRATTKSGSAPPTMRGVTQPMVIPQWNPGGYLNNACHRIAVKVV